MHLLPHTVEDDVLLGALHKVSPHD